MNQQPHTHKLEIRKSTAFFPAVRIDYGDQSEYVWTGVPGWRGRIERNVTRVIKRHDRGSKNAHLTPESIAEGLQGEFNEVLLEKDVYGCRRERVDTWGSELFKAPIKPEATIDA